MAARKQERADDTERADDILITSLACGATVETAARKADVSERTVYRRLQEADFRQQLKVLRGEMGRRIAAMLTAASPEAVKTLLDLQSDKTPPSVRLAAARAVLDLGMKLRENAELAERVRALEEERFEDEVPYRTRHVA